MILNNIPIMMIRCLLITIFIEIILSIILKIKNKKDLLNIVLVNIMTNPLVVTISIYFNIRYGIWERNIIIFILEILAIISEGFVYRKFLEYNKINPYFLSIILNFSSYSIGEIINNL